jgi:hypothetical protein
MCVFVPAVQYHHEGIGIPANYKDQNIPHYYWMCSVICGLLEFTIHIGCTAGTKKWCFLFSKCQDSLSQLGTGPCHTID